MQSCAGLGAIGFARKICRATPIVVFANARVVFSIDYMEFLKYTPKVVRSGASGGAKNPARVWLGDLFCFQRAGAEIRKRCRAANRPVGRAGWLVYPTRCEDSMAVVGIRLVNWRWAFVFSGGRGWGGVSLRAGDRWRPIACSGGYESGEAYSVRRAPSAKIDSPAA